MRLVFFGAGYCSKFLIPLVGNSFEIICTHNDVIKEEKFDKKFNVQRYTFKNFRKNSKNILKSSQYIINSIPPNGDSDIVVSSFEQELSNFSNSIKWYGYLSSTSVYGDHMGKWVNEDSKLKPKTTRGKLRLSAEKENYKLFEKYNIPVHIFRLPGIYGPGRSICQKIKKNPLIINKPGHYFSRIFVEDIASALQKSIYNPTPGNIFNLTDNLPERIDVVAEYAASLMNIRLENIDIRDKRINEKTLDFYKENKKVSNKKIKSMLDWKPKFEDYRLGIKKILDSDL